MGERSRRRRTRGERQRRQSHRKLIRTIAIVAGTVLVTATAVVMLTTSIDGRSDGEAAVEAGPP